MGYRMAEAARICTKDCTSIKDVIDLITREIVYKQLNPRITTHVRAQKPSTLQDLLSTADEYVTDSERGRESAWNRNMLYPQPSHQMSYKPFNGNKSQKQQPQPQIQSQINQPKSSPLIQQQGGAWLPTNTPAQCGDSDGNQYKPQHKLAKSFDKDKGQFCALTVRSEVTSQLCVPTGMCLLFPQTIRTIPP